MTITSFGDTAQFMSTLRTTNDIKSRLQVLQQELATGTAADLPAKLGSDLDRFTLIERDLKVLDGFAATTETVALTLDQMQAVMLGIDDQRNRVVSAALGTGPESETDVVGATARQAFGTMVSQLNTTISGRNLFSGVDVDGPTLASDVDMMADLITSLGGATETADIIAAVDDWFDTPGGGFATMGYLGDTGAPLSRRIGPGKDVTIEPRADAQGIRDVLKGAALGAIVEELGGTLDLDTREELIRESGVQLLSAAEPLAQMQGRLGSVQEEIEIAQTFQQAQITTFEIARGELRDADPYETAALLNEVQVQLELQFTITARISSLSLANYL